MERDEDLTAPYAFQNKTWIAFEDKISVGIKVRMRISQLLVPRARDRSRYHCCIEEISHSHRVFLVRFYKNKRRQSPSTTTTGYLIDLILGKIRAAARPGGTGSAKYRKRYEDRVRESAHAGDLSFLHGV